HGIEILQHIPHQNAVEVPFGIVQRLFQEKFDPPRVGLLGRIFAVKRLIQAAQEILRIEAVAQVCDEADVLLRGASQFENGEAASIADLGEELLQSATAARGGNR